MYKIFKTKILASTITGNIGVNSNFRVTMGYDETTKVISVKIDKVIRPELTREEEVDFTYELIAERDFTEVDFPRVGDHNNWFVDYDVVNNIITTPVQTSTWVESERVKDKNFTWKNVRETLTARYSNDLIPLFALKSFDNGGVVGFDHSILTFFVSEETVVTTAGEELTPVERDAWFDQNIIPRITFEVRNTAGDLVSASIVEAARNQYTLQLPPADSYAVTIVVAKPTFPETTNLYNVDVINGNANKSRIAIGDGTAEIIVNTSNLAVGDYTKVKLNLGLFISFAELWITYA
jgi:hypothetical protein